MLIKEGTRIQGKIGFQAWIDDKKTAMTYGYGGMEWQFKALEEVLDAEYALLAWLAPALALTFISF
eukprot:CAMPEP_0170451874 /NCGR_PEP_ID=MMETSP0123-20130129/972_1 /TAXON_ID=182087 /ORGANISM="Favella ehrenbergii, Strain Fehren 1" /LENGTH=65 /DNA_ID=CAMNT_0010713715 /DNA_START=639 /DNA_END=836 /DNA_ORIENTATION=+